MSAIYILWLRQLKRYIRSKPRIVASLGQPLLFLLALGFGFGPIFERAGQGSYIQFLAPGVIAMTVLFSSIFSGIELIWDRQFGFLKETLVAPVPRTTIMIGRTLGLGKTAKADDTYRAVAKMTYGMLGFALFFSVVGTILGGIWANESWGRFWGWDPKENGALLFCLSQLAILHARLGGLLKPFGVAMATILQGGVVAFSWWGVNLLGIGLHSYGFTAGILTSPPFIFPLAHNP